MNNLERAAALSNERWLASLPDQPEDYEFTSSHNKKIERLFSKMRGDKYHKLSKTAARIILIAAILMATTITAFALPQTRAFLVKPHKDYSDYIVVDGENEHVNDLTIDYIPEGFELVDEHKGNLSITYDYETKGTDRNITISKMMLHTDFAFDSVHGYEETDYNGITYIHYYNGDFHGYVWNNGQYKYDVSGICDKDELFKVAISTK